MKKRHLHIIKNHLHIKNPKRNIIKHHFLVNKAAMEFHSAPPPLMRASVQINVQ